MVKVAFSGNWWGKGSCDPLLRSNEFGRGRKNPACSSKHQFTSFEDHQAHRSSIDRSIVHKAVFLQVYKGTCRPVLVVDKNKPRRSDHRVIANGQHG